MTDFIIPRPRAATIEPQSPSAGLPRYAAVVFSARWWQRIMANASK